MSDEQRHDLKHHADEGEDDGDPEPGSAGQRPRPVRRRRGPQCRDQEDHGQADEDEPDARRQCVTVIRATSRLSRLDSPQTARNTS